MPNSMQPPADRITDRFFLPDIQSTFVLKEGHWRTVEPGWKCRKHDHPIFELNVVLEGEQWMRVEETVYQMKAGDLVLIPPWHVHDCGACESGKLVYFVVTFDVDDFALKELLCLHPDKHHPVGSPIEQACNTPLVQLIELAWGADNQTSVSLAVRMKILSVLFSLFSALAQVQMEEQKAGNEGNLLSYNIARRMAQVLETEANCGESSQSRLDTRLGSIAEQMGYSLSYCSRLFREVYGLSPRRYLSTAILKRAKLELMNTKQPLETIAQKLGFSDSAHFSKQFKRWSGMSPTEYRSQEQPF
ncbi:AraC family transcriptional regulator [Paenibacillus qinlingensis]|uniref:AraC-like DNA-binding protein n=1 Tax=Paenibacillus qinlingensis TaxID=1837343 RepID=A0ABU1P199_9BACL|nr:AraC family transcriptional regulator [Paenibacillus qinlingensis]MDR6553116.1 AraC-like DNA-binding protein [Paenibacillus qinlingensis]